MLKTLDFKEFKSWLRCLDRPHTEFHMRAGATWKDGKLVFYLEMGDNYTE